MYTVFRTNSVFGVIPQISNWTGFPTKKKRFDHVLHTIIFNVFRHVVIDNVLNVWKVQTFWCNIRCNKYVLFTLHKLLYRYYSLFLIWSRKQPHQLNLLGRNSLANVRSRKATLNNTRGLGLSWNSWPTRLETRQWDALSVCYGAKLEQQYPISSK